MTTTNPAPSFRDAGRLHAEAAGARLTQLYDEHRRLVLGLCRLLLRDPVEAEDATQSAFASAYQALLRGTVPRDAAPWIAAIARNECRARIRARMRSPLVFAALDQDLPPAVAAAIDVADADALWHALEELPRRQRRAFLLREVSGFTYGELAVALGVSESAVESLLFRARQQLRARLGSLAGALSAPLALRDAFAAKVAAGVVGTAIVAGGAVAVRQDAAPHNRTSPAREVRIERTTAEPHGRALPAPHREVSPQAATAAAPARGSVAVDRSHVRRSEDENHGSAAETIEREAPEDVENQERARLEPLHEPETAPQEAEAAPQEPQDAVGTAERQDSGDGSANESESESG